MTLSVGRVKGALGTELVISEVTQDEISKDSGEVFEMRKISLVIPMKTSSRNQVRDFSI